MVQQVQGGSADVVRRGLVLDELRINFLGREQVGHGKVFYLDDLARDQIVAPGGLVDGHRWHAEISAFQRHRAGRGDRHSGCGQRIRKISNLNLQTRK